MKLKHTLYTFLFFLPYLLYSCQIPTDFNIKGITEYFSTTDSIPKDKSIVTKVIDGDTFWINNKEKVRLIGIDAPETRNTRYKPKEPFAEQSKQFLSDLILGKEIILEYDAGKYDRYRRLLAYVYLLDSTFVNKELVKEGYALIMTVQPNTKYADLFLEMQQEARENKRGLWADDKD